MRNALAALLFVAMMVVVACGPAVNSTSDDTGNGGVVDDAVQEIEVVPDVAKDSDEESTGYDTTAPEAQPEVAPECDGSHPCAPDSVSCTEATCIVGKCQQVPRHVLCDDYNACTMNECDIQRGCTFDKDLTSNCNDNDPCTANLCDPEIGCYYTEPDINVCNNGGNLCVKTQCVTGICQFLPLNCNDGDAATIDGCVDDVGCINTEVDCYNDGQCNDNNPCTTDMCNTDGECLNDLVSCDDDIVCTKDLCDTNGDCKHLPKDGWCDDTGKMCTQNICIPLEGCQGALTDCNDYNPCTYDSCLEGPGCVHQKVDGCCMDEGDCADGNPCTEDVCGPDLKCWYKEYQLCPEDEFACTVETNQVDGDTCKCVRELDNNRCGAELLCSEKKGCVTCLDNGDCYDDDSCTTDTCNDDGACQFIPILGCCQVDGNCDDNKPCTTDFCIDGACVFEIVEDCCLSDSQCNDGDSCTTDGCNMLTHLCENKSLVCQYDTVSCTDEVPVSSGSECACSDVPNDDNCEEGLRCLLNVGCVECTNSGHCDDSNPCTFDYCQTVGMMGGGGGTFAQGGTCVHDEQCSWEGETCVPDPEDNQMFECEPIPGWCQDDWQCSKGEQCVENACQDIPQCQVDSDCQDWPECSVWQCIEEICVESPIEGCCEHSGQCDDGNQCTRDECGPDNTCSYEDEVCDDGIACTIDTCAPSKGCRVELDHDACGENYCSDNYDIGGSSGCVECLNENHCDDSNPCTRNICDWSTGSCTYDPSDKVGNTCAPGKRCDDQGDCIPWCNQDYDCGGASQCVDHVCIP